MGEHRGNEPEVVDFIEIDEDQSTPLERSLVLRAINTERNNLVKWYGIKVFKYEPDGSAQRPLFYSDQPWSIEQRWADQLAALNRFEARLIRCECCFNNADDFEHYHSAVCDTLYQEGNVPSPEILRNAGYGLTVGKTRTLGVKIISDEAGDSCPIVEPLWPGRSSRAPRIHDLRY